MTKQPPFVTKLRLSKLCRGIIALAVVKLCVLVALVADIPLPELRWEKPGITEQSTKQSAEATQKADRVAPQTTSLVMGTPEHSLLAVRPQAKPESENPQAVSPQSDALASAPVASTATPASAVDQNVGAASGQRASAASPAAELQGSAAAAAAARLRPMASNASVTMPVSTATRDRADSPVGAVASQVASRQNAIAPTAAPALASPAPVAATTSTASTPTAQPAAPAVASLTGQQPAVATPVTTSDTPAPAATSTKPAQAQPENSLPLLASGVEKPQQAPTENGWWQNMLQLKKLPIPHMGVSQVAHAAALDTPPAPAVSQPSGISPFTPPDQQIPRGQDATGAPLPPRSTTTRPLPAGSSGLPQANPPAPTNSVDPMTTAVPPPAPNVNAYSPPEDPARKQQELARREQEILMLKQQMEQRLKELESAEMRVKGMIKDATDVESQKVTGLIAVYANMKPKQAAQTLQSLDERVAVKILTGLTPKQAGEILSYADPKITAKLTELMTRMQMQP